jgi:hypothetical protein
MTVLANTEPYSQYTGTGARVFFEYGFELILGTPVFVTVNDIPVEFTQQLTGVVIEPAPALDTRIVIARLTDITQLRDFQAFEAFHADKTEDACDKLILLKQEAALYRAFCNLYASQPVEKVEIVNDKGDNAQIYLWVEDHSGAFSGEVTDKMPNAGAFVEKPLDFAYFQYGFEEILSQSVTTTLYPVEASESMYSSADLIGGAIYPVLLDGMDFTASLTGGVLFEALLSAGPYDDGMDFTASLNSGLLETLLLDTGPYDDGMDFTSSLTSGLLETLLVTVYSPDELLYSSCELIPAACSMTPI